MDRAGVGQVCLALPGATLDHPFGDDHDAYKVGGFFPDYHAMFMAHLDDAARIARGTA